MKKIIEYIEKVLDWLSKFFGRIKGLGYIIALLVFIIFFINHGCQKSHATKLIEKITGLDIKNDLLLGENKQLIDSLNAEALKRKALENTKNGLIAEKIKLERDNANLRRELAGIPAWLLNMPADSSYRFLNEVAYPYLGEKKFPFNEPQIKNIHADYIENVKLTGLVSVLDSQLINCGRLSLTNDSIAKSYRKSYATASMQRDNLEKVVSNQGEKVAVLENEVNKKDRGKKFWRITTVIATAVAIILAI